MRAQAAMVLFVLLGTSLALVPVPVATAATVVPGQTIQVNTTWDLAGSPYIVQGDVNVSANVTLTLEAGVQVLFDGFYTLRVLGGLDGRGNAAAPIAFESYQPVPGWSDWIGIVLEDGARANLSFAELRHADRGALHTRGDNLAFDNLTIEQSFIGLEADQGNNISIVDSRFTGNDQGIRLFTSTFSRLERLNITANRIGLVLTLLSDDNLLTHSAIFGNSEVGVEVLNSFRNVAYANSFIDNPEHARDNTGGNTWDGGYPIGGNLWDNHTGPDVMTGPNQNIPIPGGDGLVDTPFWIDADSRDQYPLAIALPGTPPVITLADGSPANNSYLPPGLPVGLEILDRDLQGAEYTVDGGTPVPMNGTASVNTTSWADGLHFVAVDAWDNTSYRASKVFQFHVDGTDPVVTLISPPIGSLIRPGTSIDLEILESNLLSVGSSLDGDLTISVPAPYDLVTDLWTDGNRSVSVTATDLAGNTGTSTFYFLVDGTRPEVSARSPNSGAVNRSRNETVRIEFSETMNRTSVESALSYPGATFVKVWSQNDTRLALVLSVPLTANMTYEVRITATATDVAGNAITSPLDLRFTTAAEVVVPKQPEPLPVWVIVLAVVAVLVAISAVFFLRSRRKREVPPEAKK